MDIDEFQIGQVITYILNNAVESMSTARAHHDRRRKMSWWNRKQSHHELSLQPGNFVRISISDDGERHPAGRDH